MLEEVFYITPLCEFILLLIVIEIAILLLLTALLRRKRVFFGTRLPGGFLRNVVLAVMAFSAAIVIVLLVMHCQVRVVIDEGLIRLEIPPVFTWKEMRCEDVSRVFLVDLEKDKEFRLVLKIIGTSFGDYKVGWFKLTNDRVALLVSTCRINLVVELKDGSLVPLSPSDMERFLEAFERNVRRIEGGT